MLTQYEPVCSLRSLGRAFLAVSKSRLISKGDSAFAIRSSWLWNNLREEIRIAESVTLFKITSQNPLLCDVVFVFLLTSFHSFCFVFIVNITCFFFYLTIWFLLVILSSKYPSFALSVKALCKLFVNLFNSIQFHSVLAGSNRAGPEENHGRICSQPDPTCNVIPISRHVSQLSCLLHQ